MIVSSGKLLLAFGAALILAGCQSTIAPLDVAAGSSIAAAGFRPAAAPGGSSAAVVPLAASAYDCAVERCGAKVRIVVINIASPGANANMTVEQAVRANIFNASALRPLIEKVMIEKVIANHPEVSGRLTSFTLDPKSASQRFTAMVGVANGPKLYISGFSRFVGNENRAIISISDKASVAARYARPNWVN